MLVKSFTSEPGTWREIMPSYQGLFKIEDILLNDKNVMRGVDGWQVRLISYEGIWETANIKPRLAASSAIQGKTGIILDQGGEYAT